MLKKLTGVILSLWNRINALLPKNKIVKYSIIAAVVIFALMIVMKMSGGKVLVEVDKISRGNILTTVSSSGIVESKSVKLGSPGMAGRVDWVGVAEGDRVRKGQILIKLNGYNQAHKEYKRLRALHKSGFVSDLEFERAKTAVDNAAIISPISGLVTDKAVAVGEAISMGMSVVTVVDIDNPWGEIQIDEVDIAKAAIGQKVRFTTDAYRDKEFFGHITWINKEAELKKVGGRVRMDEEDLIFRAKVSFDNAKELKPGMSVYAEIITGEKKDVLVAPREAITLREGKKAAYLISGGRVKQTAVEIGAKDAVKVEILKGLKSGDRVATSNLDKLRDRSRVKVIKK